MPCLELTIPKVDDDTRAKLSVALTDAFAKSTGIDRSIFGIVYFEYDPKDAATGGSLWDGGASRPYLHFLLYCPRISRASKQKLVASMTHAFVATVGMAHWKPVIHICEHSYDNVGVDGELLSDKYEELAQRKFYYDLPEE